MNKEKTISHLRESKHNLINAILELESEGENFNKTIKALKEIIGDIDCGIYIFQISEDNK